MKHVLNKIRSSKGFTLAETLLTVLILLMVSVIVARGVPAAVNAYDKMVIGANARILLSTTVSALRDELTTATDVSVVSDGGTTKVVYFSCRIGAYSQIYMGDDPFDPESGHPVILLQEYTTPHPSSGGSLPGSDPRFLVPKKAAGGALYIVFGDVHLTGDGTVNDGIEFSDIRVYKEDFPNPIESLDVLLIRFIQPVFMDT